MATKKFQPYFQAHTIVVLTSSPIRAILHKPDTSGRLLKWAVELSELDIKYRPRISIKGQVLANFIVERTEARKQEMDKEKWVLETNGSSQAQGESVGIIMKSSDEPTVA